MNGKPKWKRARLLRGGPTQDVAGGLVWVRCYKDGEYISNILSPTRKGKTRYLAADFCELLARDENDFADDVPLIPWEQFLKECREHPRAAKEGD